MNPFANCRYFTGNENWGSPSNMNPVFIQMLDNFQGYIQSKIVVDCGTQGQHVMDSQHALGLAADLILPDFAGRAIDLLLAIARFPFTGVGYYPAWQLSGVTTGGIHLDMRTLAIGQPCHHWMGVPEAPGAGTAGDTGQTYIALNEANLRQYGAIK